MKRFHNEMALMKRRYKKHKELFQDNCWLKGWDAFNYVFGTRKCYCPCVDCVGWLSRYRKRSCTGRGSRHYHWWFDASKPKKDREVLRSIFDDADIPHDKFKIQTLYIANKRR